MKSLKIAAATTIAMLLVATAMAAEEGKSKSKDKGPRLSPIARTLLRVDRIKAAIEGFDLTEDQKDKLVKIRDDFETKKQAIYEKLGEVLTDEQKQTAQEGLEKIKEAGKGSRELYQSIETSLKLTDEQKQKMEPIGKELQTLVNDSLKQVNEVLTPEQKEKLQQKVGPGKKKGNKAETK